MNYIEPTWNIKDVIDLNIEQVPKPDIGFDVVNGTNVDKYQGIISAGVYRGLPNFFDKTIFILFCKGFDFSEIEFQVFLPMITAFIVDLLEVVIFLKKDISSLI